MLSLESNIFDFWGGVFRSCIRDEIFRAAIDVQSILDNRQKEPENDSPSCDVQGEAPEKCAKPREPYKKRKK